MVREGSTIGEGQSYLARRGRTKNVVGELPNERGTCCKRKLHPHRVSKRGTNTSSCRGQVVNGRLAGKVTFPCLVEGRGVRETGERRLQGKVRCVAQAEKPAQTIKAVDLLVLSLAGGRPKGIPLGEGKKSMK